MDNREIEIIYKLYHSDEIGGFFSSEEISDLYSSEVKKSLIQKGLIIDNGTNVHLSEKGRNFINEKI